MTVVLTPLVGYLIGAVPTANAIARIWGVDLRSSGSGNPGTNNARRLGGYPLAAAVLVVEMGKGLAAVMIGLLMAGELGATLAGIGAIAGNVYSIFYGFQGGKGLAITGGVVIALWPPAFPFLLVVLVGGAWLTKSSGRGTLMALATTMVLSILWTLFAWPTAWGIDSADGLLILLAAGMALFITPKQLSDARHPVRGPFDP